MAPILPRLRECLGQYLRVYAPKADRLPVNRDHRHLFTKTVAEVGVRVNVHKLKVTARRCTRGGDHLKGVVTQVAPRAGVHRHTGRHVSRVSPGARGCLGTIAA